jgi:2-keto-4-pentenoate hydratase/2-oxohepta-3-ene-1,7-dioic acid hydratase in catechol pathway
VKIICVGRNYTDHIHELKNEMPEKPVIFLKPDTALLKPGNDFYYPEFSKDIHYECELVFRIGNEGKYVSREFAAKRIDGVGLGIDFTARDLQDEQKAKGLPWEIAKSFNHSAVVGTILPAAQFSDWHNISFRLEVNNEVKQTGNSKQMIFGIEDLIVYISQFFTLKTGDLIFTGTPAGVGAIQIGDKLLGFLENEKNFSVTIR